MTCSTVCGAAAYVVRDVRLETEGKINLSESEEMEPVATTGNWGNS